MAEFGGQLERLALDEDQITETFAELDPLLVDEAWSLFRAARAQELAARSLPATEPFGTPPKRLARRWWVSKFNPDLTGDVFWQADPLEYPWDNLSESIASDGHWISSEPGHTTRHPFGGGNWQRVADLISGAQLGDFVLFMRTGRDPASRLTSHPLMPHAHRIGHQQLVGLAGVHRTISYRHAAGEICQRVITAPVRLFDFPVSMQLPARERYHRLIAGSPAFARANVGYAELTAPEAVAVAAACSMPSDVLNEPDLAKVTARLARLRVGPTDEELARLLAGHVTAAFNRVIELSGEIHVARRAAAAGWAVERVSHIHGPGYDLRLYATDGRAGEWRYVEVKSARGELSDKDALHRLTPNERRVAEASAAANDDRWWCAIVEYALDDRRRRYRELTSSALLSS